MNITQNSMSPSLEKKSSSAYCPHCMLIAPNAETTQQMFGKYKPEDQTNLPPSFSDASDAATPTEKTLNGNAEENLFSGCLPPRLQGMMLA